MRTSPRAVRTRRGPPRTSRSRTARPIPRTWAWPALNGSPVDVVLALSANFGTCGGCCAAIAGALRRHYGFDDEACGFFDLFAEPAPELEHKAPAAVRAGEGG
ncbi:hypothetical protein [Streptomyces sp. SD15]